MTEPIVFISHYRIRADQLDAFLTFFRATAVGLQAEKPRTVAFLAYTDETPTRASFVHFFPDADAMDQHFEGAQERSREVFEFLLPESWEICGHASAAVLEMMQREASSAGVNLTVQHRQIGGFLRLVEASRDR